MSFNAITLEQKKLIESTHFTSLHNHTYFSNIRLLDCINKPEQIINRSIEIGYNGIAITDHEILAALPESLWYVEDLQKKNKLDKDFKFILGNEAYVVNDLEKTKENYKAYKNGFYHFILLAKDYDGYEQLKLLSTAAWDYSYTGKGMTRTPLQKAILYKIVNSNKGHLIGLSACLGNELSRILLMRNSKAQEIKRIKKTLQDKSKLTKQTLENLTNNYEQTIKEYNDTQTDLERYFNFYLNLFGDDFYLELQPSNQPDQVFINKELIKLGKELGIKWVITTDSHYCSAKDREVHKKYLNSKNGEREVDDFYSTTYIMEKEEIINYLVGNGIDFEDAILSLSNTKEIYDKCSKYSLEKGYQIPKINISEKLKNLKNDINIKNLIERIDLNEYKNIKAFLETDNEQNCYYCYSSLEGIFNYNEPQYSGERKKYNKENDDLERIQYNFKDMIDRIDLEFEELAQISKELKVDLSQYYVSMQKIIDIMWNEGDSLVGPGRGCLSKDTNVLTPSGFKNIKEIKVSDEVYDENGDIIKVSEVFEYDCDEELIEIKGYFGNQGNKMTLDHKVLVKPKNLDKPIWKEAKDVLFSDWVAMPIINLPLDNSTLDVEPISITQSNLKNTHSQNRMSKELGISRYCISNYLNKKGEKTTQKNIDLIEGYLSKYNITKEDILNNGKIIKDIEISNIEKTYDAGKLFGIFISDGWLRSNLSSNEIGFAQRKSEDNNEIPRLINKVFNINPTFIDSKTSDLRQYFVHHNGLNKLFRKLFINYNFKAETKYIPKTLLYSDENFRKGLLDGLWYGDGTHKERSKYTTVSYQLGQDVYLLLLSLGYPASFNHSIRSGGGNETFGNKIRNEYNILTSHNFDKGKQVFFKKDKKFIYYKIREINKVKCDGKVYDFTVPSTHSYVTDSYIVHNSVGCWYTAYLMGITDTNALEWGLPYWRHIHRSKIELSDKILSGYSVNCRKINLVNSYKRGVA